MARQLVPLELLTPGALGLNRQESFAGMDPLFAVEARNAIIDANGRLATRAGVTSQTTTASATAIRTLFEYRSNDGTTVPIVCSDTGVATSIDDPDANQITSAGDGYWRWQNYADELWGLRVEAINTAFYRWTGSGSASTVTPTFDTATLPGDVLLAAFGRLWCTRADNKTISYSALLDVTGDFQAASGGGDIDMTSVWTDGQDEIVALAAFNGTFIVFGRRHIVIWTDGQGSELGIDPSQMYVLDVITGTGCLSPESIQPVGETDLLFLSRNGVQSLARVIQEKSNPTQTLTKKVRNFVLNSVENATNLETDVRSTYSPENGFYLLSIATGADAKTFVLDQRRRYRDEDGDELARVTEWDLAPTALLTRDNGDLLLSGTTTGEVDLYEGVTDNGTAFDFLYKTPHLNLSTVQPELGARLKILKGARVMLECGAQANVKFDWTLDFDDSQNRTLTRTFTPFGTAEWGEAEWGEDEWGGTSIVIERIPMSGTGQYIQLSVDKTDGALMALQSITLQPKVGRFA